MAALNKITIIGVGLIGGSIGLAVKKNRPKTKVIGVFRHTSTLNRAIKRKAVDAGVTSISEGAKDADLIIIAAPVHFIPELAAEAGRYAKPGAIITDAGSTKEWIVSSAERSFKKNPDVHFIGSHPMAGSEHKGVEFASADLFEGSPCIVTKTPRSDIRSVKVVADFWKSIGGRVRVMSPAEHDKTVSFISHLPHVVAFALAGAVPAEHISCAAEGFRDTTRIASSDPDLWTDILLTNKDSIIKAGKLFSRQYEALLKAIARGDRRSTAGILDRSKSKRDKYLNVK